MIKKQYMKPSMKAIKLESTNIICGSGDGIQTMSLGDPSDYDDAPTQTSEWGYTGIWGE